MSNKREDYISWDEYFMGVAALSAMRSKDPGTQVGACIVSPTNKSLKVISVLTSIVASVIPSVSPLIGAIKKRIAKNGRLAIACIKLAPRCFVNFSKNISQNLKNPFFSGAFTSTPFPGLS